MKSLSFRTRFVNLFWHLPFSFYANLRYGKPSGDLQVIGVTGTDGKTTVCSMIYHILKTNDLKVGMISTISAKVNEENLDIGLHVTTPAHPSFYNYLKLLKSLEIREFVDQIINPESTHKYLAYLKKQGVEYVVLEVTSQGLDQKRLHGIQFDEAVYTNIKEDHLDYHITRENYLNAKAGLINLVSRDGNIIINADDESASELIRRTVKVDKKFCEYSVKDVSDYEYSKNGIHFKYLHEEYNIPIIGEYNLSNALAASLAASKYLNSRKISRSFQSFITPVGRMQIMQTVPYMIIVDFAHTPTALEQALKSIVKLKTNSSQKVITVFGCAGKRDETRRKMGFISAKFSDITVPTAEDPRDEQLVNINSQILEWGMKGEGQLKFRFSDHKEYSNKDISSVDFHSKDFILFDEQAVVSRGDAIDFALKIAKSGDMVYITGKGHEQSLAFGDTEHEWSDQAEVVSILNRGKRK